MCTRPLARYPSRQLRFSRFFFLSISSHFIRLIHPRARKNTLSEKKHNNDTKIISKDSLSAHGEPNVYFFHHHFRHHYKTGKPCCALLLCVCCALSKHVNTVVLSLFAVKLYISSRSVCCVLRLFIRELKIYSEIYIVFRWERVATAYIQLSPIYKPISNEKRQLNSLSTQFCSIVRIFKILQALTVMSSSIPS